MTYLGISGDRMTIALPGSSKFGLSGLLGRKRRDAQAEEKKSTSQKPLEPHEVAKLFTQDMRAAAEKNAKPAKLNDSEKQDRARLSSLRGALYSKD